MNDFDPIALEAFQEAMAERYDFARCQRTDGSTYGIPNDANCKSGKKTSDKKTAMTQNELVDQIKQSGHQLRHTKPGSREERQIKDDMMMQLRLKTV